MNSTKRFEPRRFELTIIFQTQTKFFFFTKFVQLKCFHCNSSVLKWYCTELSIRVESTRLCCWFHMMNNSLSNALNYFMRFVELKKNHWKPRIHGFFDLCCFVGLLLRSNKFASPRGGRRLWSLLSIINAHLIQFPLNTDLESFDQ